MDPSCLWVNSPVTRFFPVSEGIAGRSEVLGEGVLSDLSRSQWFREFYLPLGDDGGLDSIRLTLFVLREWGPRPVRTLRRGPRVRPQKPYLGSTTHRTVQLRLDDVVYPSVVPQGGRSVGTRRPRDHCTVQRPPSLGCPHVSSPRSGRPWVSGTGGRESSRSIPDSSCGLGTTSGSLFPLTRGLVSHIWCGRDGGRWRDRRYGRLLRTVLDPTLLPGRTSPFPEPLEKSRVTMEGRGRTTRDKGPVRPGIRESVRTVRDGRKRKRVVLLLRTDSPCPRHSDGPSPHMISYSSGYRVSGLGVGDTGSLFPQTIRRRGVHSSRRCPTEPCTWSTTPTGARPMSLGHGTSDHSVSGVGVGS